MLSVTQLRDAFIWREPVEHSGDNDDDDTHDEGHGEDNSEDGGEDNSEREGEESGGDEENRVNDSKTDGDNLGMLEYEEY